MHILMQCMHTFMFLGDCFVLGANLDNANYGYCNMKLRAINYIVGI